jgi:hypothetical protein
MSFGEAWGFGADEKESHRILGEFGEAGGNFIDTANAYHQGQSEEIVGSFLGPGRDRWMVATKYTLAMRSGDPNTAGNSRKSRRPHRQVHPRRVLDPGGQQARRGQPGAPQRAQPPDRPRGGSGRRRAGRDLGPQIDLPAAAPSRWR